MKVMRNIFALIVIASMLLTACKAATPTAPPEEAKPGEATPEEAKPEEPEEIEEEIELTFWHQEAVDRRVKILQTLLDEFYEETGIKVVQETMTWDTQYIKLMTAIEAGTPPDITWGTQTTAVTLKTAEAIYPVTDIVEEIDEQWDYVDSHRDGMFWDGEYWGVPIFALSYNFWYRIDMFEEAGLDIPETWDEVVAAAEALNNPPTQWGIALPTGETSFGEQVINTVFMGVGGLTMSQGNNLTLNSPAFIRALELYEQLAQYTPPDSGIYAWPEAGITFAQRKAAMLFTFNAVLDYEQVEANVPENLGVAKIPHDPGAPFHTPGSTLITMISTPDPVKRAAAKKWLLWMMEPENYGRWAAEFEPGLFLPITQGGADSAAYWEHEMVAPYEDQIRLVLENTKYNYGAWYPGDTPDPNAGVMGQGRPKMTAVQMILYEGATYQEAADHAENMVLDSLGWLEE